MTDVRSLAAPLAPGTHALSITHGGRVRTFLVRVPPAARAGGLLPTVVNFHGGGSNAVQHQRHTGMDVTADRHGFVAVHPDGTGVSPGQRRLLAWNAGGCCPPATRNRVDDVGFTIAAFDELARRLPLDPARLYVTGMSNGGMMAHRMAADAAQRVAAIASVAGQMNVTSFAPSRPVPVMVVHSVDDYRAAYYGRTTPRLTARGRLRPFPPVEGGVRAWVDHNGCPPAPHESSPLVGQPGTADDGQAATTFTWGPGRAGSEVVLVRLSGAGHVWPGAARELPRMLGRATMLFDANELIWSFFSRHRLPSASPPPPAATAPVVT